jgi:hypothetical protein
VIHQALTAQPEAYFRIVLGAGDSANVCLPYLERMHNWAPQSEQWLAYAQTGNYNYFLSNRLITRIHVLLLPLSAGDIYTHLIFFNFISLLGIVFFLNSFRVRSAFPALVFVLLPSTLLWCSGLLKDNIVFAALCFIFGAWENYKAQHKRIQSLMIIFLCCLALLYTKFYILAGVAVYLIFEFLLLLMPKRKAAFLAVSLIVFAIGVLASPIGKSILNVLSGKREEALKAAVFGEAQNQVFYHPVDSNFLSVMYEVPMALWDAFFSPLLFEAGKNPLLLFAAFENTILLLLLLIAIIWGKGYFAQRSSFSWLLFLLTLAFIIGFTSPVTGGLMRYKTAFVAFAVWMAVSGLPDFMIKSKFLVWFQKQTCKKN